MLIYD
jgi:hypothetical protein